MTPQLRRSLLISLFFISILGQSMNVSGQGLGGGGSSRIDGKYKFMPIPYVNYDRSMGFAAGAVPMLMFNPTVKDTISPSSLVGGVGMYSTNKTWFTMGFGKLLPGVGTGIRYVAFLENHFSVGLDVAAGLNDWGIYFQIGQAF